MVPQSSANIRTDGTADSPARRAIGAMLPQRGWEPHNRQQLLTYLTDWSQRPQGQGPQPLAIFDWDNTCIFNDIADATLRYQLQNLLLRFTPDELQAGLPQAAAVPPLFYQDKPIVLDALYQDLLDAYRALWPAMQQGAAATVINNAAHQDFCCKLGVLYQVLEQCPAFGPEVVYPWLVSWYRHFSWEEVEQLAQRAWQAAAQEPIGPLVISSASAGQSGKLSYRLAQHIHLYPEMADLMAALQYVGVEVGVVTASYEPVVRGVARLLGVAAQGKSIVGMQMPAPAGVAASPHPAPITYRQGKVEAIKRTFGRAPVLVAGDATTDYEMLTGFAQTEVRLLIHRQVEGPITQLHQQAAAQRAAKLGKALAGTEAAPGPPILLQGHAMATGQFWPQPHSG